MKYSCVKSIALPKQLLLAPLSGSYTLPGVLVVTLLVSLSGCAVDKRTHHDADIPSEWDIKSVPTDAANFVVDELDEFNTTAPDVSTRVTISTDTVTLATTSDLKLRQAPSTSAATISVFSEGTMLTARKLSCGNWTEIVDGKRTIGYMHSYFLTSP